MGTFKVILIDREEKYAKYSDSGLQYGKLYRKNFR